VAGGETGGFHFKFVMNSSGVDTKDGREFFQRVVDLRISASSPDLRFYQHAQAASDRRREEYSSA
jgi:hypothetical protein